MVKKFLTAVALVIASPALVFSQDIFWSFDNTTLVSNAIVPIRSSGVATIFADGPFGFDALDLNFTTSDSSVLLLTGGTVFNDPFSILPGTAFDSSDLTIDASGSSGTLFSVNTTQNGINPAVSAVFNPHWEAGVGAGGAVKLAEVYFDVVLCGVATLDFSLGTQGALQLPAEVLDPSFGSAELNTGCLPEPSSAGLLVLGAVGVVACRRRSVA